MDSEEPTRTSAPALRVTCRSLEGATVITPVGEIDISTIELVRGPLTIAVRDGLPEAPVVIDLSGVSFMDSTGLRTIVDASDSARSRHQRLVLFGVPRPVERVLEVTKLDTRFPRIADLESATLAALAAAGEP